MHKHKYAHLTSAQTMYRQDTGAHVLLVRNKRRRRARGGEKIPSPKENGISWTLFWVYNKFDISHQFAKWAWRAWHVWLVRRRGRTAKLADVVSRPWFDSKRAAAPFVMLILIQWNSSGWSEKKWDAAASWRGSSKINCFPVSPACCCDHSLSCALT